MQIRDDYFMILWYQEPWIEGDDTECLRWTIFLLECVSKWKNYDCVLTYLVPHSYLNRVIHIGEGSLLKLELVGKLLTLLMGKGITIGIVGRKRVCIGGTNWGRKLRDGWTRRGACYVIVLQWGCNLKNNIARSNSVCLTTTQCLAAL